MIFSNFFRRLGRGSAKQNALKSREDGQYKKLPRTLKELGPSYDALIRELAKR